MCVCFMRDYVCVLCVFVCVCVCSVCVCVFLMWTIFALMVFGPFFTAHRNLPKSRNWKRLTFPNKIFTCRVLYFLQSFYVYLLLYTAKRPLGRPMRRWEDNIRMDVREMDINARNWVDWSQDRDYWRALVNAALNLRVP